jgi:hypothetical protein
MLRQTRNIECILNHTTVVYKIPLLYERIDINSIRCHYRDGVLAIKLNKIYDTNIKDALPTRYERSQIEYCE